MKKYLVFLISIIFFTSDLKLLAIKPLTLGNRLYWTIKVSADLDEAKQYLQANPEFIDLSLDFESSLIKIPEDFFSELNLLEFSVMRLGTKLPESIGTLRHLKVLYVVHSRITSLPESIGNLIQLQEIHVHNNGQLLSIPKSIGNLINLLVLDFGMNRQLTTVPESIGNLINLVVLDLGNDRISVLPESIGNLRSLKRLLIQNNKLSNLPATLPISLGLKMQSGQLIIKMDHQNETDFSPWF
ncbi:TPA: hypothetical protein DEO28_01975 [Candidatus Dependentiae bacterium]|nr:MAG: Small GTP-binding protein [candidate division TM6 bacterium GW2011_GWE2_31_21]KKP52996.1 MAG: Small GTP-binding protein [candidate division TM6 bacterium GW2011_GWF2_33_332]HBS47766.1 hypothetical protein [Candidatus Dependentiae bacterium]HBZ73258.1 hypothetical protein [Candidatus Dependentiae bacterium]